LIHCNYILLDIGVIVLIAAVSQQTLILKLVGPSSAVASW